LSKGSTSFVKHSLLSEIVPTPGYFRFDFDNCRIETGKPPGDTGDDHTPIPHITRDPDTGQFVSGSHGFAAERYTDFEYVHNQSIYDIDAEDLPGSFPVVETDINVVDLDDIMDRHERANLVMLRLNALQASVPGTSSAESALETRYELGVGAGSEMVENADTQFDQNVGSSGAVDRRIAESDSADVLFHASWIAEGSFADSASGLGGGPDTPVMSESVHYPNEFGVCPAFDDRDEITESFRFTDVGSADISDSVINLETNWTLVFGITERD